MERAAMKCAGEQVAKVPRASRLPGPEEATASRTWLQVLKNAPGLQFQAQQRARLRGDEARGGRWGGAVSLCARRCLCCGVLCVLLRTVGVSCDGYSKGRFIVLSFVVARRMVGGGMLEHSHLLSAGARAVSLTTPFAALRGFFSIARRVH